MNELWILGWWNLIYIVPFGLALLYMGIYTATGMSFGEADADVGADTDLDADAHIEVDADAHIEVDADAHVEVDADTHVEVETDAEADAETDADHDHDMDSESDHGGVPLHHAVLNFVGIGRIPLSLWLTVLMMSWGLIGFGANQVLRTKFAGPVDAAMVSIPAAAIGSLLITRLLSGAMKRWLPLNETYALRRHELLGSVGEAILPIDRQFGMLSVRDEHGKLFHVPCRLQEGSESIGKGHRAQLVAYSAAEKLFYVVRSDSPASTSA